MGHVGNRIAHENRLIDQFSKRIYDWLNALLRRLLEAPCPGPVCKIFHSGIALDRHLDARAP